MKGVRFSEGLCEWDEAGQLGWCGMNDCSVREGRSGCHASLRVCRFGGMAGLISETDAVGTDIRFGGSDVGKA